MPLRKENQYTSHKQNPTLGLYVLGIFRNPVPAGSNRFIPAEEYGSELGCEELGCEDCLHLTGSWKGAEASVKPCSF